MEGGAEGTSLARLSVIVTRNAGCVLVAVMAKRGEQLFRCRSKGGLNFREPGSIRPR